MTGSERRIIEDERARTRARVRKKRRRRQRKILLGIFCLLILLLIGGIVFAVSRHRREKQKQEFLKAGVELLEQESYEEAIARLDDALQWSQEKIGEFETTVLLYRADAEFRLQDYDAAQNTYTLLMDQDPENADYKKGVALCLIEKGDYDAALSYGVMDGYICNLKAVEQIQAGEYDAALELIERGKAAGDSLQDLSFNEAVAWENKGDFAKALELFEAYAAQYGADDTVERELAFLRSRQGNVPEADGSGESGSGSEGDNVSGAASESGTETGGESVSGSPAESGESVSGAQAGTGGEDASGSEENAGGEETSSSAYSAGQARG